MIESQANNAVVVGAGPNGLAAAVRLAQAGLEVVVLERNPGIGGGVRTVELTLPGFQHDICSAIHPLGLASPFFRSLGLERHGLAWIHPEICLAHPLDDGTAVVLRKSIEETANELGRDGSAWRRLFTRYTEEWAPLLDEFLQPMLHLPRRPWLMAHFGLHALWSARTVATTFFGGERARALFAGLAAHSLLPLEKAPSASFGLVLGILAHAVGWPLPRGGSQQIATALGGCLKSLGGEVRTGCPVQHLDELSPRRRGDGLALLDVTPRQFLRLAAGRLPVGYERRLSRYRYGPGVFKIDYALSAPIPWKAPECRVAGTVHLGGTFQEIARAEHAVSAGRHAPKPFVLVAQPSVFDPTRAPAGKHVLWAYCHVPLGSRADVSEAIEDQIERFAPGFKDCILARHKRNCQDLERDNPNLVQGDINGGAMTLWQILARPILSASPYRTPLPGVYLCSASTPPGGGVHGMCGFYAAEAALRYREGRVSRSPHSSALPP